MSGRSVQHAVVFDELVEWWQDPSREQIGSQAVLVPVPSRWGRTTLLEQFAAIIEEEEAVSIVVAIDSVSLPDGLGLQAQKLRDLFRGAYVSRRVAELLGVDRLGGVVQLGLAVGGLFATPLAAMLGLLLTEEGLAAAGRAWDTSPAGQEGAVARLARAVAAVSVSLPVVVVIDDADRLEPAVAVTLIENLIERADGQVLVVAATDPGSELASALVSQARYGLTQGRVHKAEVSDPGMGYQARAELAAELCPWLPTIATRHIARRVATFADVFAVARTERLAELDPSGDEKATMAVVDEVIDARPDQADPSPEAVVLAWAGGVLHDIQADRALAVLGAERSGTDQYVVRLESLVRLANPASPRLAEQVRALATSTRHRLAAAVLDTAVRLGADPGAGLVERVVARQAAHRVRADLDDREQAAGVQRQLVRSLEELGDSAAAYEVARTALTEYIATHPGGQATQERDELSAAVLRLARTSKEHCDGPLIETTIASALAGGAAVGLEARVWAAVDLLDQLGRRETALKLVDEVTAELANLTNLGPVGDQWRLLLAFHAGRAGYPAVTQRMLTPMLNAPTERGDAARAVLFAVGGPAADTRLQIVALEAELQAVPADAEDDRLRLHRTLGSDYAQLGNYHLALEQGRHELALRRDIQGADHPDTLRARGNIAEWTGYSGDPAEALRLFQELLPDRERVLGPDHPEVLATRNNIATWSGHSGGDPAEVLRLFQELLPDQERVLGPDHPEVLVTRNNIAVWTAYNGDPAGALRLSEELLPDQERVLGPDHPSTLTTRSNMASWRGELGDPAGALRLFQELLPDQERVLGPDHPEVLATRNDIAVWTAYSGDPARALCLFQELLPDLERVFGPSHPNTLATRQKIERLNPPSGSSDV